MINRTARPLQAMQIPVNVPDCLVVVGAVFLATLRSCAERSPRMPVLAVNVGA